MLAYVLLRGIQQRVRERRHYCFDRLCDSSEGILSDGNWTHCENFRGRERDVNAGRSDVKIENFHFRAVVFFVMKSQTTSSLWTP